MHSKLCNFMDKSYNGDDSHYVEIEHLFSLFCGLYFSDYFMKAQLNFGFKFLSYLKFYKKH